MAEVAVAAIITRAEEQNVLVIIYGSGPLLSASPTFPFTALSVRVTQFLSLVSPHLQGRKWRHGEGAKWQSLGSNPGHVAPGFTYDHNAPDCVTRPHGF